MELHRFAAAKRELGGVHSWHLDADPVCLSPEDAEKL
jgi:hypothetical protein